MIQKKYTISKRQPWTYFICSASLSLYLIYNIISMGELSETIVLVLILSPIPASSLFFLYLALRKGPYIELCKKGITYGPWKKQIDSDFAPWTVMKKASTFKQYHLRMHFQGIKIDICPEMSAKMFSIGKYHQWLFGHSLIIHNKASKSVNDEISNDINFLIKMLETLKPNFV